MDLRWRTVVVTGAGTSVGREVAVRLARAGAGVVAVDRDLRAGEATAALVRERRVAAWTVQADLDDHDDLALLAARLRDLGGADALVHAAQDGDPSQVVASYADGLTGRRGRAEEPGALVVVGPGPLPPCDAPIRLMGVVPGPGAAPGPVALAVLDLLTRGIPGAVVVVAGPGGDEPRG